MVSLFTEDFSKPQQVQLPESLEGQRLDNCLLANLKGVPRTCVYRLVRKGEVRLNKGRVKPSTRLKSGDILRIPPIRLETAPQKTWLSGDKQTAERLIKRILYEDRELIVLNKPAGFAVHGGSGVNFGVIEALRQVRDDPYLELVHRLDRDTSGCLLIAKRRSMLRKLHELFRENAVQKTYYALVKGDWQGPSLMDAPLKRRLLSSGDRVVSVSKSGQSAQTEFQVIEPFEQATLMCAKPKTGRTHQIRVHCQFVGNPILGDIKYGDRVFDREIGLKDRLYLHAKQLELAIPGRDGLLSVEAPLDETWKATLSLLGGEP